MWNSFGKFSIIAPWDIQSSISIPTKTQWQMHCMQHNGDMPREFFIFPFFIEKTNSTTNSSKTTTFLESVYGLQSSNHTPYQSANHWLLYNKPAVWGTVLLCFCSRTVTDDDCRDKLLSNERERVGHILSPTKGTLRCLFLCFFYVPCVLIMCASRHRRPLGPGGSAMPLRPEARRSLLSRLISRRMNPIYSPLLPLLFPHPPLPLFTVLPVFCPIVLSCLLINSPISTLVPAVTLPALSADCTPAQTNNKLYTEKLHKQKKHQRASVALGVYAPQAWKSLPISTFRIYTTLWNKNIWNIFTFFFRNTIQLHLSHDSASENKVCLLWLKLLFVLWWLHALVILCLKTEAEANRS